MTYQSSNSRVALASALFTLVCGALILFFTSPRNADAELASAACIVSTSTAKTLGISTSQVVLATSSNRAWARITHDPGLDGVNVSTVFLSIAQGAPASTSTGIMLATTTPDFEVGRNTHIPYTGAISAFAAGLSTVVLVTECLY